MKDLAISFENRPGALARMGEALGRAGVSIEGGGAWVVGDAGAAHFLFEDGAAARRALEEAGITVVEQRDVVVQRLKQAVPGQLGMLTRRMAEAGVNIEVLYSDHDHRLVLVVDDLERGRAVAEEWSRQRGIEPSARAPARVPAGWHTVTPRIVVDDAAGLVAFLVRVFGATGDFRPDRPSEIRIGHSIVMVSGAEARAAMPAFLYVYVDDVDRTHARAVEAGALSLEEPGPTPYGDRRGMVRDPWGNLWQIASRANGG